MRRKAEPISRTERLLLAATLGLAVLLLAIAFKDVSSDSRLTVLEQGTYPSGTVSEVSGSERENSGLYIINTTSKKFHLPDCARASSIKAENRSEVENKTADELEAEGFSPCGSCIKTSEKDADK
ncbi:MAG: hypothetical protein GX051_07910 [Clostridiales bacterium]|nr:hypothetical protein [Clostridiales bacterium]